MARIIWTEPALENLDAIADYISLDNLDAAFNLVKKVFSKVELLKDNPKLGRIPGDLKKTSYRRLVVNPLHIYYRIDGESVIIIHITRAEREFNINRFVDRN
jgi:toxin ParE1/3/4